MDFVINEQVLKFLLAAADSQGNAPETVTMLTKLVSTPVCYEEFLQFLGNHMLSFGVSEAYEFNSADMPFSFMWTMLSIDSPLVEYLRASGTGIARTRENGDLVTIQITPSPHIAGLALMTAMQNTK